MYEHRYRIGVQETESYQDIHGYKEVAFMRLGYLLSMQTSCRYIITNPSQPIFELVIIDCYHIGNLFQHIHQKCQTVTS